MYLSPPSPSDSRDEHSDVALDLLRLAVDKAPQGVLILSDGGTIITANQTANKLFGYDADELVGRPLGDLIPEVTAGDDLTRSTEDRPVNQIATGTRKDGVPVPVEVAISVSALGRARFVIVSITDATDIVHLQARLMAVKEEHLGFQRLVADIALEIAGAESSALDQVTNENLRKIGEALQLDRAILWRKGEGESTATPTHYWVKAPYPSPPQSLTVESVPYSVSTLASGEPLWFSRVEDIPDPVDRETFERHGPASAAVVPVSVVGDQNGVLWALELSSMSDEYAWVPALVERLRLVAGVIGQALARRGSEESLSRALGEIDRLRDRLAEERVEVRRDVRMPKTSRLIVAESAAVKRALLQVEQVATTPATVLLRGETGTGKEVFAQAIHDLSPRHARPMSVVSCAAIPTALIESELFGRERGAYTGALSRQIGRFEAANQSTLFLDEIGELPMEMQVKLLRVIQERTIERLGSTQPIKVDVRIIAATHRDLEAAVQEGVFREDLFYRLNVFPIVIPPLRERVEDIPGLVWSFIDEFSRAFGKTIDSISKANMRELQSYRWPGNVRELRNVIERAVILSTSGQLVVPVPREAARVPQTAMTLEALEIEHIKKVLESTNWRVRGAGGAAERLGLKPTTLESRMARLGISRKRVS